jgi:hypothetical protein
MQRDQDRRWQVLWERGGEPHERVEASGRCADGDYVPISHRELLGAAGGGTSGEFVWAIRRAESVFLRGCDTALALAPGGGRD